ncbi:MAG: DUF2812 domain-containing protein [Bacillota bacterium]|jgi:hypothetical protein
MEKPKSLFRFWFLFSWQIGQIQAWLEAMAARGWHLSRFGDFLAVFRQGPPGEVRYRCDCFKFRNPELRDKIDLYAAAGWQYLGSRGETHIFRAEDPAAPEIHTDPQEYISATTRLRRGLIVLAVALALAIPASIYRLVRDFPSWRMAIQHGSPTTWVVIALSGYSLFFLVWHLVGIFRLLAWVRGQSQAPVPHRLDRLVNLVWATLLLLLVITMGVEFTLFFTT